MTTPANEPPRSQRITPLNPPGVSESWFLAFAGGEVYDGIIVRGADLLKTYAKMCFGTEENADAEELAEVAKHLADADNWYVVDGRCVSIKIAVGEDGDLEFQLITDLSALVPAPPHSTKGGEQLPAHSDDSSQLPRATDDTPPEYSEGPQLLNTLEAVAQILEEIEYAADKAGKPYTWEPAACVRVAIKRLTAHSLRTEQPIPGNSDDKTGLPRADYSVPTPRTEAFMLLIDDSSIDLEQVRSFCDDLECELIAARTLEKEANWNAQLYQAQVKQTEDLSGALESAETLLAEARERNDAASEYIADQGRQIARLKEISIESAITASNLRAQLLRDGKGGEQLAKSVQDALNDSITYPQLRLPDMQLTRLQHALAAYRASPQKDS